MKSDCHQCPEKEIIVRNIQHSLLDVLDSFLNSRGHCHRRNSSAGAKEAKLNLEKLLSQASITEIRSLRVIWIRCKEQVVEDVAWVLISLTTT